MMSRLVTCTVAVGGHESVAVLERESVPVMRCAGTLSFAGSVMATSSDPKSRSLDVVGVRTGDKAHVFLDMDAAFRDRLRMAALDACVPPDDEAGMGLAPNRTVADASDQALVVAIPADRLTSQGRASVMMHRWLGAWYKIKHQVAASGELNK